MSEDGTNRTLNKNCIDNFILKFDINYDNSSDLAIIVNKLSKNFVRLEKKMIQNFTVKFTEDKTDTERVDTYDYVLISDDNLSLTFSCSQNAFWFETTSYINNATYKKYLKIVINAIQEDRMNIVARRIGMRFINNFKCNGPSNIGKIYGKRLSAITRNMLINRSPVRVIGVEQLKVGDNSIRLQYGIPNKFFPSEITTYDLLLDIDSFVEDTIDIDKWESTVSELNHLAYNQFIMNMNHIYLGEIK